MKDLTVPAETEIMGAVFKIDTVDECDEANRIGECSIKEQVITVQYNNKVHKQIYKETLLHEVIHVILDRLGLQDSMSDEKQELICGAIGTQILTWIEKNPWILKI